MWQRPDRGGVFMPTPSTTAPPNTATDLRTLLYSIEQTLPTVGEQEQVMLYYRLGSVAFLLGEVRTIAQEAFARMHGLAVQQGDKRAEALALNGLSCVED